MDSALFTVEANCCLDTFNAGRRFDSTKAVAAQHATVLLIALFALALATIQLAHAQIESVLYTFCSQSGCTDGAGPSGLVMDKKGNLYGTTWEGGVNISGTVFKLTPAGTETVLHSFPGESGDGGIPRDALLIGKKGNLYGTTWQGGLDLCSLGCGTVFKMTSTGKETVLYSFGSQSGDGYYAFAGLTMDKAGNLYGTTVYGGAYDKGTVFKLTSTGTETVLYSLGSQSGDGANPYAGVTLDKAGNLYGTAYYGGANGYGTLFKITPAGQETVLYSFGGQAGDGASPYAGRLLIDKKGNLYGTTWKGGAYGNGTVFKVTTAGAVTVLYSFGNQSGDGANPYNSLIMDKAGNLYGTTEQGGAFGYGTVFELTSTGTERVLYNFGSQSGDGTNPFAGLVRDIAGDLYGTTGAGGAHNLGTAFKLVPQ